MQTYSLQTQRLIKSAVTVPVYADYVPESVPLPAISWINISREAGRVMAGVKTPAKIYHRMFIIAKVGTMAQVDPIVTALTALDNTSNQDFQRIEISISSVEPLQPESPVFRVIFDLTLTAR